MSRIIAAFFNSMSALKFGLTHEAALRDGMIALALSVPVAPFLTLNPWKLLAMWGSLILVLCVELLNTGIEKVADRVTRENSDLIKIAKDSGSAAVLMAILFAAGVWGVVLVERLLA